MKRIIPLVFLMLCSSVLSFSQSTFCLQLSVVSNDGADYVVKIEMQGTNNITLGSGNLQFNFPGDALSNPVIVSTALIFPSYFDPTVTQPFAEEASFNIELLSPDFNALPIANAPGWTELAQISFTIDDAAALEPLSWSYNGGTTETVQYLGNEVEQIFATSPDCLVFVEGCATDFNNDGITDGEDFSIFLGNFGIPCSPCDGPTNLDGVGITDGADFAIFLGNFGLECQN